MFRRLVAVVLLLLVISLPVCADSWGVTWQWNQFTKDYETVLRDHFCLTYDYDTGNEVSRERTTSSEVRNSVTASLR